MELKHYGVKGMKWGKRKSRSTSSNKKSTRAKAKSMSDDDLKKNINRLKLEKEYIKLSSNDVSKGRKIVSDIMVKVATQTATSFVSKYSKKVISEIVGE